MDYDFIQAHCLAKKGTTEEYKPEWDAVLYKVGGKIYVLAGNDGENRAIISVKLKPEYGEELRETFADIVPGYHLNKKHWNSLYLSGNVPEKVLKDMLDQSYELVLGSLNKKLQNEISDK